MSSSDTSIMNGRPWPASKVTPSLYLKPFDSETGPRDLTKFPNNHFCCVSIRFVECYVMIHRNDMKGWSLT